MLWTTLPGANCENPAPDLSAIADLKASFAEEGYAVFAESGRIDGARAVVIEHSDPGAGTFDVEAAIDHFRATENDVIATFAMPVFRWRSGVVELEGGERLFYFDDEVIEPFPRRTCIVEGIGWDEFRNWERRDTEHPLRTFCTAQLRQQRDVQSKRDRERWKDLPPIRAKEI
ncbi:hypothetical protein [Pelagerythrobacter rhizovicinus]|uniref:Uncharacterized protein n=1 Tax=Pelagerythrobacter rhizovicinus TaxID=2268576 RepID=A0A4Q2KLD3_9SPHN|nr:hypothetical protein [Pelagerythrobacter rhizovicinus]RXZ65197.1 hypothetical protein ETX26_00030 [Pelagerythrobacter rhizovicinus]